ncbi:MULTISPECIES: ABC transporter permease [Bacillus]|uniref:ABC transporter permease n=1 Tax=Bacillus TaxID=1386 RepID=UPI0003018614|nr:MULTISPECIES: ABC transporter permease [Bacillus]
MLGILLVKFRLIMRNPWSFIISTVSIIAFAYLLGANISNKVEVPVYSELPKNQSVEMIDILNKSNSFQYKIYKETEAVQRVEENKSELAVGLKDGEAVIVASSKGKNEQLIGYEVSKAYMNLMKKEIVLKNAASVPTINQKNLEKKLDNLEDYNVFKIEKKGFKASDTLVYDSRLQSIFGFALFFSIFTIAFNVVTILIEKQEGVWNRMLLSPLKKWKMYTSNLLYAFIIGYAQIAIVFFIFRFGLGISFYGAFGKTLFILVPYVFCIIALTLLIAALVKTMQQFNVMIPLVAVSMAMIGGAYWPLEIVTSDTILTLSKIVPLTYAMEALKGATVYGHSWDALIFPTSIMLLMGVVMIGLGIKVIDRK